MPGYDNRITIKCSKCEAVKKTRIGVNTDIFGIRSESISLIHSEIFDLCYHSNGAFTQEEVYTMPTRLRSFYIQKLVDVKKAEVEAQKKGSADIENRSPPGKIARPALSKSR